MIKSGVSHWLMLYLRASLLSPSPWSWGTVLYLDLGALNIVTFRPNPQGLNPQRYLWGFFWCCHHSVHLPLPAPRVPSELPRACEGSQWLCRQVLQVMLAALEAGCHGGLRGAPKGLNPSKWVLLSSASGAPRGSRKGDWHARLPEDSFILYQCKSVAISVSHQGTPPVWGGDPSLFVP